ncbi:hypothetical protein BC941DRAFT_415908 [Chlamydoabsidia padenii]|nr:hypothetical protein BC941DRAFT_415908 [Chlamydoabsidia padenii]
MVQVLSEKSRGRILTNRWTKAFLSLSVSQVVISLPLLIVICTNISSYGDDKPEMFLKIRHVRIEVIWYILFEVWRLWLVIDALIHCSSLTVITCGVLNLFSAGFGAMECMETMKMKATDMYDHATLQTNLILQIVLTGIISLLFIPTTYVVYKLALDYGWKTYRKVGAHMTVQAMYFTVSCFILILKIDTFFQVLVMIFYTVLDSSDYNTLSWIPGVVALLCLLNLLLARNGVSNETHWKMVLFIIIELTFVAVDIWMLYGLTYNTDPWFIVLFYGATSILMVIVTLVFAIKCEMNFGKGLKPFGKSGKKKTYWIMQQKKKLIGSTLF